MDPSWKPWTRVALMLAIVMFVSACAQRGLIAHVPARDPGATVQRIHVVTNRAATGAADVFGRHRAGQATFAAFDVSIPAGHRPGRIEWPSRRADPARHFVATGSVDLGSPGALVAALRRDLGRKPPQEREVILYVHGFNVRFAEGLYRFAQVRHDFGLPGAAVAYSWPSAGSPVGYLYDRDSVLASRDGLADLIARLAGAFPGRVVIVAHSLGGELTMEALRQLALSGHRAALDRLGGVVLLAPDIGTDVFATQVAALGRPPQPFVVVTSKTDRALLLSARASGQTARVGNADPAVLGRGFPGTVIDISAAPGGDPLGHATAFTSPAIIQLMRNLGAYGRALNTARGGVIALDDLLAEAG